MHAIVADNNWIYFSNITDAEENILWNAFSVSRLGNYYVDSQQFDHWDGVYRKYNRAKKRLARPFLAHLKQLCAEKGLPLTLEDRRPATTYATLEVTADFLPGITLEEYQVKAIQKACRVECGIFLLPTGSGKCLGKGTPVMMFDGSIKPVEQIVPGDKLMGDDSTPRNVLSTCVGVGPLYQVSQVNGDSYVVNQDHILSLYRSKSSNKHANVAGGTFIDISVSEYLTKSKWMKHILKGYKVGIEFDGHRAPFDPYLFGVWLGDGISKDLQFCLASKSDQKIIQYLSEYCTNNNYVLVKYSDEHKPNCDIYAVRLYKGIHKPADLEYGYRNPLKQQFKEYNLFNNKHIPTRFMTATRDDRLKLLAGIIDADGYAARSGFHVTIKKSCLAQSIVLLARSLGFRVHYSEIYKRCTTTGVGDYYSSIYISGHTDRIPTLVPRKQCDPRRQKKNPMITGIKVEPVGDGEYYGFALDNNKRFLLGDCTVTHNTELLAGICKAIPCPTVVIAGQTVVIDQIRERLQLREAAAEVGYFYAGKRPNGEPVVVGTIQSLMAPTKVPVKPTRREKETERAFTKRLDQYALKLQAHRTRLKNARYLQAYVKRAEMILVDEADTAVSNTYKNLFRYLFRGRRRYGFTGTMVDPSKPVEAMVLKEHLGSVIFQESRQHVEALGRIVPTEYFMFVMGLEGSIQDRTAYDIAYEEQLIQNDHFHDLIIQLCQRHVTVGNLILVERESLGQLLERKCLEAGIRAAFIYGKTTKCRRTEVLTAFQNRELSVLIGGKIINRGLDLVGGCENLIVAASSKSQSEFLQKVGRALRRNQQGHSRIYDFFWRCNHYLYGHSKVRLQTMVEAGYPTSLVFRNGIIDGAEFIRSRFRIPSRFR